MGADVVVGPAGGTAAGTFLRLSKLPNGVWCEGRQEESGRGEQRGQFQVGR